MTFGINPNPIISNAAKCLGINKRGIICTNEATRAASIHVVYCNGNAAKVIKAMN